MFDWYTPLTLKPFCPAYFIVALALGPICL